MKGMKTTLALIVVLASSGFAETARWPLRIVETSYTVNTLTGAEFGHRQKEKSSVVAVDISKKTVDGKDGLALKRRVTRTMQETESETGEAFIDWAKMPDLIDAVSKAKSEMSKIQKPGDFENKLFTDEKLKATLTRANRRTILLIEFGDGDCYFELEPVQVSQFLDMLKKMYAPLGKKAE
jgi:hypothetical protein